MLDNIVGCIQAFEVGILTISATKRDETLGVISGTLERWRMPCIVAGRIQEFEVCFLTISGTSKRWVYAVHCYRTYSGVWGLLSDNFRHLKTLDVCRALLQDVFRSLRSGFWRFPARESAGCIVDSIERCIKAFWGHFRQIRALDVSGLYWKMYLGVWGQFRYVKARHAVQCCAAYSGSKTHKRLKERFLIRRNRTKRANFRCNHLFQATYNATENS